jgi:hypothetical protein
MLSNMLCRMNVIVMSNNIFLDIQLPMDVMFVDRLELEENLFLVVVEIIQLNHNILSNILHNHLFQGVIEIEQSLMDLLVVELQQHFPNLTHIFGRFL